MAKVVLKLVVWAGSVENTNILGAFVSNVNVVSSEAFVGGLIGLGLIGPVIRHSYVVGGTVSGRRNVGGLGGNSVQVYYSYAAGGRVSSPSDERIGGLLGQSDWDNSSHCLLLEY